MDIYGQQKGVHDIISIEFIALKVGPRISHWKLEFIQGYAKVFHIHIIHIYSYL